MIKSPAIESEGFYFLILKVLFKVLQGKKILLIISGGIAAYKSLELIRILKKNNADVKCILTEGGSHFVTPLSLSSLSQHKVYTDLWSLTDEAEMGHIRLSRECDLIVVAPASADILAKMAHGLSNDLASTCLLASNKPVLVAPAMNPEMWGNAATKHNVEILKSRNISFIGPEAGDMACGETGLGRMSEPEQILTSITDFFFEKPLKGLHALVTSGPTYEAIDPVRFLGNRSSGKQGYAIAQALRDKGANVTLISGPCSLPDPAGITIHRIESAKEMLSACLNALPADIAVCAAAVSDWRAESANPNKLKKQNLKNSPDIKLVENPDILKTLSIHPDLRPALVVGFAAETENLRENARQKLERKGCNWIIANEVGKDAHGAEKAFGQDLNTVSLVTKNDTDDWPSMNKNKIAEKLADLIVQHFEPLRSKK